MSSQFQLVPTPNPLEFMVAITVPDRIVNEQLKLLPNSDGLEEYTPYNKFTWIANPPRVGEFGSYRYVFSEKAGADATTFFFAKTRTDEERNTPFKDWTSTRHYVWPAVLLDFYVIESSFDISNYNGSTTQNATRYLPRFRYVPSTPHDSKIRIRQYLSDTPWPSNRIVHPQPVPTDIDGSYLGVKMSFPRCLHRRVTFTELVPGARIVYGVGMEGSGRNGTPREQIFPATNFSDWVRFDIEDVVQPTRGLYLRERVTIYPPDRGEPIEL